MKSLPRRKFLGRAGAALAIAAGPAWGCRKAPPRQAILASLVEELVVPDVQAVLARSRAIEESAAVLAHEPSQANLDRTRGRWREALLAWRQAYCFRNGPLVTTSAFLRAAFWPTRLLAVDALARGQQAIDDAAVRELGVDEKGLFALEHLLFGPPAGVLVERQTAAGDRSRHLVVSLAHAVTISAEAAASTLGDGKTFGAAFAARGQESVSLLVNQLADTIETIASSRLARLLGLGGRAPRPNDIEGLPSAMMFQIPRALVAGTERVYLGGTGNGLGALVRAVSPAIDDRARAAFARSGAALDALVAVPIAEALAGRRADLEAASRAVKDLEVALKTDVSSALGVTLVFTGGDGD
jgi:predicted lipoprotein